MEHAMEPQASTPSPSLAWWTTPGAADQPWGDRVCAAVDPEGRLSMFAKHVARG
jgi:hypothetical protein